MVRSRRGTRSWTADAGWRLAARIGSDVPFFLAGGAALVEGRGERVQPLRGIVGGPGVLLVTPAVALPTPAVFAAFAERGGRSDGSVRMSSEHLAGEVGAGLRTQDLLDRAGVLAAANDLLPAAAAVLPGLVPFRRALFRVLGRPVGLSGSGPTLWTLYPSEDDAAAAATTVHEALAAGTLPPLGVGDPIVVAHHDPGGKPPMTRQSVSSTGAPAAIGPYSQAIAVPGAVYCSGQIGLDPASGELVEGVEAQAERALRNLAAVLDAAGVTFSDVVKTTIFLTDMNDFAAVNAIYARFVPDPPPARSTVAVAAPPEGRALRGRGHRAAIGLGSSWPFEPV